jgi:hypothetical protein
MAHQITSVRWHPNYEFNPTYNTCLLFRCECGLRGHYYIGYEWDTYQPSSRFVEAKRCNHARGQIGCVADVLSGGIPDILEYIAYGHLDRNARRRLI